MNALPRPAGNSTPDIIERLRLAEPDTIASANTKTALPVRGTPEERAVRHCVRTLQEVANWLDTQPEHALALRLGSLRVSLADALAACKTAVRVINEGHEESR